MFLGAAMALALSTTPVSAPATPAMEPVSAPQHIEMTQLHESMELLSVDVRLTIAASVKEEVKSALPRALGTPTATPTETVMAE